MKEIKLSQKCRVIFAIAIGVLTLTIGKLSDDKPSRDEIVKQWLKNGTLTQQKLMFDKDYEATEMSNKIRRQIISKGYYQMLDGRKIYKVEREDDYLIITVTR